MCVMVSLAMTPAGAEAFQSQASEAIGKVVEIAPDAGIVLVLDNVADQRASQQGESLNTMLSELGVTGEDGAFSEAWAELSDKIGLREDVAFDKFFGRRVVFVSEGLTIAGGGQWAIATVVDESLALRVIKRLGAKGRDYEAGQAIFAIEGGAYRISPVRVRDGAGGKARLFVIAPRQSADLFRTLVRGLSQKEHWADLVGQNKDLATQNAGVLRADNTNVAQLTVLMNEEGWNGQALLETPGLEQLTPGWSAATIDKVADNAWLVLADEVDAKFFFKGPLSALLPLEGDLPERLSEHATDRVLLSVGPVEGGVAIMVALELDGTDGAAAVADEAMRGLAVFLTGNPDASPDYAGFMASAVRTARLEGVLHDELLEPMLGKHPNLSWMVHSDADRSWWVFRIGPASGAEAGALEKMALALPSRDEGGRLSSLGIARPGPLAGMVDRVLSSDRPMARPMKQIETFRWSSRQRPGQTEIGFSVRMNSAPD